MDLALTRRGDYAVRAALCLARPWLVRRLEGATAALEAEAARRKGTRNRPPGLKGRGFLAEP